MKTAIATVCLSGALDEKLEAIARAGFERVELFEADLLSFNGTPADVRRMIDDAGLTTILCSHSAISRECPMPSASGP